MMDSFGKRIHWKLDVYEDGHQEVHMNPLEKAWDKVSEPLGKVGKVVKEALTPPELMNIKIQEGLA